jgi:hypothetical protein
MHEVYRDMYEAIGVTDVDRLMKKVPDEEPRPLDPASENINALDMVDLWLRFRVKIISLILWLIWFLASSPAVGAMPPVAMAMQKHVMEHVKLQAEEQAMMQLQQAGPMPAEQQEMQYQALVAQGVAQGLQQSKQLSAQISGAGQPDPLVKLKEQELQIKSQAEQADAQLDQAKLQLDAQNQQMRSEQFNKRLASQEAMTQARIESAMQREIMKQRGQ